MNLSPNAARAILAHRDKYHPETHRTARSYLAPLLGVALLAIYTGVQLHDDNVALREEVNRMRSTGCPDTLGQRKLTFSDYAKRDFLRPHYERLSCYYGKGVAA